MVKELESTQMGHGKIRNTIWVILWKVHDDDVKFNVYFS